MHDDRYSGYNNYGSKFTFQLHLQVQVLFSLYIPVQTDQIHIRMQTAPAHVRFARLIKLKAAKTRIQELVNESEKRGKSPRKQSAKYDSFEPVIVTLWLTNILLFFSAPNIDKLKIWRRQILSRFLVEPNKFCQSSASGPYLGHCVNLYFQSSQFWRLSFSSHCLLILSGM